MVEHKENGAPDQQRHRAKQRPLTREDRQHRSDHRIAHMAVGTSDDQLPGGVPRRKSPLAKSGEEANSPEPERKPRNDQGEPKSAGRTTAIPSSPQPGFQPVPRRMAAGTSTVTVPGSRAIARACRHILMRDHTWAPSSGKYGWNGALLLRFQFGVLCQVRLELLLDAFCQQFIFVRAGFQPRRGQGFGFGHFFEGLFARARDPAEDV